MKRTVKNNISSKSGTTKKKSLKNESSLPISELSELAEFMKLHSLSEVEWQNNQRRIVLRKDFGAPMLPMSNRPQPVAATNEASLSLGSSSSPQASVATPAKQNPNRREIVSPLVGTFYRAPGPDAQQFVQLGQSIRKGQVLCIVEAMKLMNSIESEFDGVVVEICVENTMPVEFGQVLFRVEPKV